MAVESNVGVKVSNRDLLLYALPSLPYSLAYMPVVNFIPSFYSTELGVSLAVVGFAIFGTRLFDIATDPLIGVLSDRSRSRFGRRKSFIALGIPLLMVAVWMLFVPGEAASGTYLFVWFFVLYFAYTLIDIPYRSWGAELSKDYDDRSRIKAWRGGFEMAGTLTALTVAMMLELLGYSGTAMTMFALAVLFVIFQPLSFGLTLWRLPEPPPERSESEVFTWKERLQVFAGNRAMIRLSVGFTALLMALVIAASLNLIFMTQVIGRPEAFATALFIQNIIGIASIPLWLKIAERYGKHRAFAFTVPVIIVILASFFLLDEGDVVAAVILIALEGVGLGAWFFLAPAMLADVVDVDESQTGEERTGLYFSVFGMINKAGVALGVLVGTSLPALFGFQPSDPMHSEEALLGFRLVFSFAGVPLALIALLMFWNYPVTRAVQRELRERIDAKRLGPA
jgi:glycoside/pentoside/hexuronide:cation symporter, GPH family